MTPETEQRFLDLATKVSAGRATDLEAEALRKLLAEFADQRERFEALKTDIIVAKDIITLIDASEATGPGLTDAQLLRLKKELGAAHKTPNHRRWLGLFLLACGIIVAVIAVFTTRHSGPTRDGQKHGDSINEKRREFLLNKKIFLKAKTASEASTFEGAQIMLNQIDLNQISDPDLASYVAISKKIADFCPKVGIPRSADPSWSGIIKNIDLVALGKQAIHAPLETLQTGREIQNQLPIYDTLNTTLTARYGLE
jgi:hypothetical protein